MLDVIFALGSVSKNAELLFERQKNITWSKIDKQTFPDTKYGFIVYGDRAKTHLTIKNDLSNNEVKILVKELTWTSAGTRLNLALTEAYGTFTRYDISMLYIESLLFKLYS